MPAETLVDYENETADESLEIASATPTTVENHGSPTEHKLQELEQHYAGRELKVGATTTTYYRELPDGSHEINWGNGWEKPTGTGNTRGHLEKLQKEGAVVHISDQKNGGAIEMMLPSQMTEEGLIIPVLIQSYRIEETPKEEILESPPTELISEAETPETPRFFPESAEGNFPDMEKTQLWSWLDAQKQSIPSYELPQSLLRLDTIFPSTVPVVSDTRKEISMTPTQLLHEIDIAEPGTELLVPDQAILTSPEKTNVTILRKSIDGQHIEYQFIEAPPAQTSRHNENWEAPVVPAVEVVHARSESYTTDHEAAAHTAIDVTAVVRQSLAPSPMMVHQVIAPERHEFVTEELTDDIQAPKKPNSTFSGPEQSSRAPSNLKIEQSNQTGLNTFSENPVVLPTREIADENSSTKTTPHSDFRQPFAPSLALETPQYATSIAKEASISESTIIATQIQHTPQALRPGGDAQRPPVEGRSDRAVHQAEPPSTSLPLEALPILPATVQPESTHHFISEKSQSNIPGETSHFSTEIVDAISPAAASVAKESRPAISALKAPESADDRQRTEIIQPLTVSHFKPVFETSVETSPESRAVAQTTLTQPALQPEQSRLAHVTFPTEAATNTTAIEERGVAPTQKSPERKYATADFVVTPDSAPLEYHSPSPEIQPLEIESAPLADHLPSPQVLHPELTGLNSLTSAVHTTSPRVLPITPALRETISPDITLRPLPDTHEAEAFEISDRRKPETLSDRPIQPFVRSTRPATALSTETLSPVGNTLHPVLTDDQGATANAQRAVKNKDRQASVRQAA